MRIQRYFTQAGQSPYEGLVFTKTPFERGGMADKAASSPPHISPSFSSPVPAFLNAPESWGVGARHALEGLACTFFEGNHQERFEHLKQQDRPAWLTKAVSPLTSEPTHPSSSQTFSASTLFDYAAALLTHAAWPFFEEEEDAHIFFDELRFMLAHRYASPDEALWSLLLGNNTHFKTESSPSSSLPHANEVLKETSSHPDHSGSLPPENLPFKSITSHDLEDFLEAPLKKEAHQMALLAGQAALEKHSRAVIRAVTHCDGCEEDCFDPKKNTALKRALGQALDNGVPMGALEQVLWLTRQGFGEERDPEDSILDQFSEDIFSSSGKLSGKDTTGQALALSKDFLEAVDQDDIWPLKAGAQNKNARHFWRKTVRSVWETGQPDLVFTEALKAFTPCCDDEGPQHIQKDGGSFSFQGDPPHQADLNLITFLDEDSVFDFEGFEQACRLWTIALDASWSLQRPDNRQLYRPLRLGFASLGGFLMAQGLAYNSVQAQSLAGGVASLMTAMACHVSGCLAETAGAFPKWHTHASSMKHVLIRHREALTHLKQASHTRGDKTVCPRTEELCQKLLQTGDTLWETLLTKADEHGFRHIQTTGLTHQGWTSRFFDADSEGVLPVETLFYYKTDPSHTREEGHFTFRPSVLKGLQALGYDPEEQAAFGRELQGHHSLRGSPGFSLKDLAEKGFTPEILARLEEKLEQAFDFSSVFNAYVLGEDFCRDVLHLRDDHMAMAGTDFLKALGFDEASLETAKAHVFGKPAYTPLASLRPEHGDVFLRPPSPEDLIIMASTLQPFISGGVGLVVRLSASTSLEETSRLMRLAASLHLKTIRFEREGARLSDPAFGSLLADLVFDEPAEQKEDKAITLKEENAEEDIAFPPPYKEPLPSQRRRLPDRRKGYIQKASIGGHKVYLHTGEFDHGELGEIFIDMHKEGAAFRSLMNNFAISISIGLQYGVPLEEFVDAYIDTRFAPAGRVEGNDSITQATSILDYIFRELAVSYLGRDELAQIRPEDSHGMGLHEGVDESPISQNEATRYISKGFARGNVVVLKDQKKRLQKEEKDTATKAPDSSGDKSLPEAGEQNPAQERQKPRHYTGDPCPQCGHFTLTRHGGRLKCDACGVSVKTL